MKQRLIKTKDKYYAISLKKGKKGYIDTTPRVTKARNYKQASKKLNVTPYAMREYGVIVSPRTAMELKHHCPIKGFPVQYYKRSRK